MRKYTIEEAAEELGYTEGYVRTLIREGKLRSDQQPLSPGSKVWRHIITDEHIDEFLSRHTVRSRRDDNRNKFTMYATYREARQVIEVLEDVGLQEVADLIQLSNDLKGAPQWLAKRNK